jgi:hypothetical protein
MAADASTERMNYVTGLQAVAKQVLLLNAQLSHLNNMYLGGGLSGTFVDAELAVSAGTKHMVAADIGTFTANLNSITTALTSGIIQNMAKAVGNTPF